MVHMLTHHMPRYAIKVTVLMKCLLILRQLINRLSLADAPVLLFCVLISWMEGWDKEILAKESKRWGIPFLLFVKEKNKYIFVIHKYKLLKSNIQVQNNLIVTISKSTLTPLKIFNIQGDSTEKERNLASLHIVDPNKLNQPNIM